MKPKIFLIVLICAPLFISNCKKDSADQDKPHLLFNSGITYGAMADNDGNTYKTIQIGTQLLMAENLKTTKYSDGTAILNVTDNTQWSTLNTAAYCWYNNDSNYKAVYGALYNFYAVSDIIRNLCPKGWIVPGDDDWSNLTTFLGTEEFAGGKMKETGTTHWLTPNTGATNESGFTGLPGGERRNDGPFADMGSTGYWWCSTMHGLDFAWHRRLRYDADGTERDIRYWRDGLSVRCLMQEPVFGSISDIDGNTYKTVKIGGQTWMAENLKTTKYRDGTAIPNISNDAQWSNLSTGAWCWYGNDVNNKAAYGALYNWFTVVDSRHLCPAGWHVPGDAEWTTLITLYGESIAGGKMKETGTTHWNSPNTGADNFSGFKGLPGGGRQMGGTFAFAGSQSFWWSTAAKDDNYAWSRYLAYNYTKAYRYSDIKLSGFSVRCIQD